MAGLVEMRDLRRRFDAGTAAEVVALDGVSCEVAAGSFVSLVGPSGSGKSTLLYLVGAMDRPSGGQLWVLGRALHELSDRALSGHRREVGFVFQRFNLLPQLTARDNVLLPLLSGRVGMQERARADELLEAVGLFGRRDALPSQLSGGQQQRVAIARALMREPRLLLADEPTGNLDSGTGAEVLELLAGLRERRELTVVLATHDPLVAERGDRILALRDGRLVADVSTDDGARVRELLQATTPPDRD
jgi:putative ABC transport system ATP-binding protein